MHGKQITITIVLSSSSLAENPIGSNGGSGLRHLLRHNTVLKALRYGSDWRMTRMHVLTTICCHDAGSIRVRSAGALGSTWWKE